MSEVCRIRDIRGLLHYNKVFGAKPFSSIAARELGLRIISICILAGLINLAPIPFPLLLGSQSDKGTLADPHHVDPPISDSRSSLSLLLTLSLSLPLDIHLRAPLLRLGIIMHQTILLLLLFIARQGSPRTAQRAVHTIFHAVSVVRQLALGFHAFSAGVLLRAGVFEVCGPDESAEGFFGRAHGLVPLALCAAGVVVRDSSR